MSIGPRFEFVTHTYRIPVPCKPFHPSQAILTLNVPHTDFPILAAASQKLAIRTQRQGPDLICVAIYIFPLFPLLLPLLRSNRHFLTRPQVPFDHGTFFTSGVKEVHIF